MYIWIESLLISFPGYSYIRRMNRSVMRTFGHEVAHQRDPRKEMASHRDPMSTTARYFFIAACESPPRVQQSMMPTLSRGDLATKEDICIRWCTGSSLPIVPSVRIPFAKTKRNFSHLFVFVFVFHFDARVGSTPYSCAQLSHCPFSLP